MGAFPSRIALKLALSGRSSSNLQLSSNRARALSFLTYLGVKLCFRVEDPNILGLEIQLSCGASLHVSMKLRSFTERPGSLA